MSKMMVQRDPSSGVTTMTLLVGSRNTTGAISQLSIGPTVMQAETALGEDCKMIRCLPNSISEFWLAVTMSKVKLEVRP